MSKTIRGIDDEVFRKFKARVKENDRNIGEVLTETMINWLEREEKQSLNDFKAWDWGEKTRRLSEDYRQDLYG